MAGRATLTFVLIAVAFRAFALQIDGGEVSFEYLGKSKQLVLPVPDVELSAEEMQALYEGRPIPKLLDGRDGLKAGWMRFFADCDPVTAWYIVTDVEHFSLQDPSYPATGPMGHKLHTFMPYTADCVPCKVGGRYYVYQLLVMPLVAPRKYSLLRHHNRKGFPWESAWELADKLYCADMRNKDFEQYFKEAVVVLRNNGSFLVAPLPPEFRRSPSDLNRADIRYFVDVHPAGNIAKLKPLVNLVNKIGLPDVARLINFHAKHWREHMEKYHSKKELEEYLSLRRRYMELYKSEFRGEDAGN